jgi:hypothetical protein
MVFFRVFFQGNLVQTPHSPKPLLPSNKLPNKFPRSKTLVWHTGFAQIDKNMISLPSNSFFMIRMDIPIIFAKFIVFLL